MYDLSELRAQVGAFIEGLGWRPVMSEHDSFPIDPDVSTVANSRQNVRENAGVFVLIVGSRYGSIDRDTDKSVTNLEFIEANARGIPSYVFLREDVRAQLAIWRANPEADFSSIVDTPRIFEFIDSFRGSGKVWTFPFATAQDIVATLRSQFAFMVQDALELRKLAQPADALLDALSGEPLMLALHQDDYWEHRLFATVLQFELDARPEMDHSLSSGSATHVPLEDLPAWMQDRVKRLYSSRLPRRRS